MSRARTNPDNTYGMWPDGQCYRCGEKLPEKRRKLWPDFCDACAQEIYIQEGYRDALVYFGSEGFDVVSMDGSVLRTPEERDHRDAFHKQGRPSQPIRPTGGRLHFVR
ncbi:MAG: hypothetical protein ACLQMF_20100 [Rectinemataceae bacterium]